MKPKILTLLALFILIGAIFLATQKTQTSPPATHHQSSPDTPSTSAARSKSSLRKAPSSRTEGNHAGGTQEAAKATRAEAIAIARDPEGNLPQGEPVLAAPAEQVLDDPRDHGGIIIPHSNSGIYVPGEKAELSITSGTKSGTLTPNQNGTFPLIVIIPEGKAEITLTYPDLQAGTKIDLFCADGGTINGEGKLSTTLDTSQSITVSWQGNRNLGYHSIAAFAGPSHDEKIVRFWVGPRGFADTNAAYKN